MLQDNDDNDDINPGRAFMQRYRSQPVHAALSSPSERDDNLVVPGPMMRGEHLMAWDAEKEWVLNGLLDADGRPMEMWVGMRPIGFLAQHD